MKPKHTRLIIVLFIITCIILYLYIHDVINNNSNNNNNMEAFSGNDISKIVKDMNDASSIANQIPSQINNINSKIDNVANQIEQKTNELVTKKLTSVFTQLGDVLNDAIVNPILILVDGLQSIIMQIFNIILLIGNKIISLPTCIFIYMIYSMIAMFKAIFPFWITYPIIFIFKLMLYILMPIFYVLQYLLSFIGFNISLETDCFEFNVKEPVEKMNNEFKDMFSNFKNNFGNINMSKIAI